MSSFFQTTFRPMVLLCFIALFAATDRAAGEDSDSAGAIRHFRRIELSALPNAVALSGDGKTIVAASGSMLIAFDAVNGQELHRWEQSSDIVDICVSANGRLIAVTTGSPIIDVYERESGERLQQLHRADAPPFLRDDGQQRIAFYPDGKKLTSSGTLSRIYVSDVETGDWDHIMWVKYDVSTPVVSPDGAHVALIGMQDDAELSGQVTMFRVRRGLQPLWTKWHETENAVTHAAFSLDGSRLATTGAGDGVRVWDVESGDMLAHVGDKSRTRSLSLSFVADRNHLLIVSPRAVLLRRLDGDTVVASVEMSEQESLRGSACSHDGAEIVTFGGAAAVDVWSVQRP